VSLTAALAGFLFGFDTVVISGAEQDDSIHSGNSAQACTGSRWLRRFTPAPVVGSLLGSWPTRPARAKSRRCRDWNPLCHFQPLAVATQGTWNGSLPRAHWRASASASPSVAAPLYIRDRAPAYRGRLAGLFQFNIVFGIIIAFLSNYLLRALGKMPGAGLLGSRRFRR